MPNYTNSDSSFYIDVGWYSAEYFNRAGTIAVTECFEKVVTMQVFQKNMGIVCGINEAVDLIKNHSVGLDSYPVEIKALKDGDEIYPWEPVMHITGRYWQFAKLESLYLGILARQTKVASNTRAVVHAAKGKDVLCFADRFDHYLNQNRDGYAAMIGGARGFATPAMTEFFGDEAMGTMPHALIACFDGDVVAAGRAFRKHYPEVPLVALVDFNNDCVTDSVRCLKEFGNDLYGVRLDTSEKMIDESLRPDWPGTSLTEYKYTGVNPYLVRKVRHSLDKYGGEHVKIIASGGFGSEKITKFENEGVPVDVYAVGSGLLKGNYDFTADIVKPVAKTGRKFIDSDRLKVV